MNLFELAQTNQLDMLKTEVTNINITDTRGRNLLHYAVIGNSVETVLWLINQGINVNQADESGETVLLNVSDVQILNLQNPNCKLCKPNIENRRYELPIHIAAGRGDWRLIHYLLKQKQCIIKICWW